MRTGGVWVWVCLSQWSKVNSVSLVFYHASRKCRLVLLAVVCLRRFVRFHTYACPINNHHFTAYKEQSVHLTVVYHASLINLHRTDQIFFLTSIKRHPVSKNTVGDARVLSASMAAVITAFSSSSSSAFIIPLMLLQTARP